MEKFKKLGINDKLIRNLKNQGITTPTPIQTLSIPKIIDNYDLMAEAQTGTGKTLAFLLPMFQKFDLNSNAIQGLIITPTRELAIQITDEANKLAIDRDINILSVFGGRDINAQLHKLSNKVTLVIATPGRLIDHIQRNSIDLTHLKSFVIDEADQMLFFGFKEEIETIIKSTNSNKQTLCFSATLDSKVKKLAYRYMNNPLEITVKKTNITLDSIEQKIITSSDRWKQKALFDQLDKSNPFLAIIFCRTIKRADKLEEAMSVNKYLCNKLHGDMTQSARQRVMKSFREAKIQYLIATDVAARGLDITGVTHIFNYDIPETPEIYIHRIGRTGRMGDNGIAITFLTPKDEKLLHDIEQNIKMKIPKEEFIRDVETK